MSNNEKNLRRIQNKMIAMFEVSKQGLIKTERDLGILIRGNRSKL